jgi:hypothetical protein
MTDCRIGAVGFYLAPDLIPSRVRLSPWTRQCEDRDSEKFAYHGGEEGALTQSMLDRVSDLLRSRRCIALEQIKPQNNATVDSCLYHLRAAVGSASALFDSLAVLAHLAFKIPVPENSGDMAISLRRREFRKPLREAGGSRLAATASQTAPLLHLIWSLRTPVLHRERLSGFVHGDLTRCREAQASRVVLSDYQADRLAEYCSQRRTDPEVWGFEPRSAWIASVDSFRFGNRFTLESISAVEKLLRAFAEDLGPLTR